MKKTFIIFSVNVVLFFLIFFCLEFAYRLLTSSSSRPHMFYYNWSEKPFVMFSPIFNKGNVLGYKDIPQPKTAHKTRVILVGGSVAFDLNSQLLASYLPKNFEVINLSSPASISRRDLVSLVTEVLSYKPDLVVWLSGYNDFWGGDPRPNYPHNYSVYENNPLLKDSVGTFSFKTSVGLVLFQSKIFRDYGSEFIAKLLFSRWRPGDQSHPFYSRYLNVRAKALIQNLVLMKTFTEAAGARFYPFLQPYLAYKNTLSGGELQLPTAQPNYYSVDLFHESLSLAQKRFLDVIDYSALFQDEKEQVFIDWVHLNSAGNEILTKALAQDILSRWKKDVLIKKPAQIESLVEEDFFYAWKRQDN